MKKLLFVLVGAVLSAQTVRFQTNLGDIDVTLLPESAPLTVQNFLKYVNRGSYNNSFFHRSVPSFIIQGGGFQWVNDRSVEISSDARVPNEFAVSNTRGTIAMAKLGNDPNSATTQWFFNLANNASNLNNQNGGFTVFGRVATASMSVIDRIAALQVYNAGSPFDQLPLQNYRGGNVTAANLVMVTSIRVLEPNPAIRENGIISASGFGGFTHAAPGSYIEIYGSDLAAATRTWSGGDFDAGRAPTTLDGVTVTVDGKPAYVYAISPTQVNVQVPEGIATGGTVPVIVSNDGRSSAATSLSIRPIAGGLLAPTSFRVDGKQYAAAVHHATGAFVSSGNIPNVAAAPAVPGETLVFYGIGFGPVTPGEAAGRIATGSTAVTTRVEFRFSDVPAEVTYAGLVPDLVGVYQFNVVVPPGLTNGDVELKVTTGGEAIGQTLFVPVRTAGN
jgi:uncharacterized protein (TIGR03437 family)